MDFNGFMDRDMFIYIILNCDDIGNYLDLLETFKMYISVI